MPLLDSILDWFRRKPKDTTSTQTPTNTREVPTPMAESLINSITLCPDLSTLYLIDNGNAIPFDLNTELGVVIGTLDGQLTVASALPDIVVPTPDDDDDLPDDDEDVPTDGPIERLAIDADVIDSPIRRIGGIPRRKILRLSTKKTNWTLLFIKDKGVISIMGASDIDISIMGASDIDISLTRPTDLSDRSINENLGNQEVASRSSCQLYSFAIIDKTINIKRIADTLYIAY